MAKKTYRNLYCDNCHILTDHLKISLEEFTKSFQSETKEGKAPTAITPAWIVKHGRPYKCGKCAIIRTVKSQHNQLY